MKISKFSTAVCVAGALWLISPFAQAQAPLKIGVLDDMSGIYAESSGPGVVIAAKMAVEDFGGKVAGRDVEVLSADHQNKSDGASAIARRWYEVEDVRMVVGLSNSAVALAVQQLSKEKERIDIVSGAATTELTGAQCSPYGFHWTYDTYGLANATASAIVENGGSTWYFLTADYAFGKSLEKSATDFIVAKGGRVLGSAKHPLGTTDFSSMLLNAQASQAKIVGIANAGEDAVNTVKQAVEFGLVQGGQRLAGLLITVTNIHALGLETAQGLTFTEAFYWDTDEETRAWAKRFMVRHGSAPTMQQAGVYSAVTHYLKAVRAVGSDSTRQVADMMRATPVDDFMTRHGTIRKDGRVIRDLYLLQAKKPQESTGEWDLMKVIRTIPGEQAFRPLGQGHCPLVGE